MPSWLLRRLPDAEPGKALNVYLSDRRIETVCRNSRCPNIGECYSSKNVSFLILGKSCTRNCRFCAVHKGLPERVRSDEAFLVAEAVRALGLTYVVITSVTRDDLPDGGAGHYRDVVTAIKKLPQLSKVEALTPDFMGSKEAIETVINSGVDVFAHNMETVERLYPNVRPDSDYERSLGVLQSAASFKKVKVKSGFMLGLGESVDEVLQLMEDIRRMGCDFLTIGQYLQPKDSPLKVAEYVHPEVFAYFEKAAYGIGFRNVASGSYVRSSYNAEALFEGAHHEEYHIAGVR